MPEKKELTNEELEKLLMEQSPVRCKMKQDHKYIKLKSTSKDN